MLLVVVSYVVWCVVQALADMAPKYILEHFLEAELMVNITEHQVGYWGLGLGQGQGGIGVGLPINNNNTVKFVYEGLNELLN